MSPPSILENKMKAAGLSEKDLVQACLNVGCDLECGKCAEQFYTGNSSLSVHNVDCRGAGFTIAEHRVNLLTEALQATLERAGVLDDASGAEGPMLIAVVRSYCETKALNEFKSRHQMSLMGFLGAMDDKLAENDHKGNWDDCSVQYLAACLCAEVGELLACFDIEATHPSSLRGPREAFAIATHGLMCAASVLNNTTGTMVTRGEARLRPPGCLNGQTVAEECADIANFAMMISEVAKKLKVANLKEK